MPEIQVRPRAFKQRPYCASCHDELGSNDAALACTACGVPLHWECWRELKRCPNSGCEGKAKSSDRLNAELAEWGPVTPLVRGLEKTATREALANFDPLERRHHEAPKAPSLTLVLYGALAGLIVGVLGGVTWGVFSAPGASVAPVFLGLLIGAIVGAPAGAALGYVQGLIGLRHPQPKGLGVLSLLLICLVAGASSALWGLYYAVCLGIPTVLLCGRFLGFDPGTSDPPGPPSSRPR